MALQYNKYQMIRVMWKQKLSWILLVGLLFVLNSGCTQRLRLKIAADYLEKKDYPAAIEIYEQILERKDIPEAAINLAEAYRKINNTGKAEQWYAVVVRSDTAEPQHYLRYGQMLQKNGKCESARKWYRRYLQEQPEDTRGQFLLRACDYQNELMTQNEGLYDVRSLWFNSKADDFSPATWSNKLFFTSDRHEGIAVKRANTWNDKAFLKLFEVEVQSIDSEVTPFCNFAYTEPVLQTDLLEARYHEASIAFSDDASKVFLTRSNFDFEDKGRNANGVVTLQIYQAEVDKNGNWQTVERLPFNDEAYSFMHPALSPDGQFLYFASDMPGGFGGMDLYVSEVVDGRFGSPVNLGEQINTEGNEVFPFFHHSGLLYFASDGQIGLGGLDIYVTEERARNEWSIPQNLGYPINTIADDFSIIINEQGTCGYFASNRKNGMGGDDIYNFVKKTASVQLAVYDAETNAPIPNATIEYSCSDRHLLTGQNGRVTLEMPLEQCCLFTAGAEGFQPTQVEGCTKSLVPGEQIRVNIPLVKELEFALTGIVFDQSTGLPLDEAEVSLIMEKCQQEVPASIVTDATGRFTFDLEKNCCYSLEARRDGYLGYIQEGHCTEGLKESEILITKFYLQPELNDGEEITKDGF